MMVHNNVPIERLSNPNIANSDFYIFSTKVWPYVLSRWPHLTGKNYFHHIMNTHNYVYSYFTPHNIAIPKTVIN